MLAVISAHVKPTPEATYERAKRLANVALWTVSLQCRRLRSSEPEDAKFIFRRWVDFELLIVALMRLRRAASIALAVPHISAQIKAALGTFDAALPHIKKQRDVAEHFDKYAIDSDRRHDKSVWRQSLEVGIMSEDSFQWLGKELKIATALAESEALFAAIKDSARSFRKHAD